jgi:hypothetical protein
MMPIRTPRALSPNAVADVLQHIISMHEHAMCYHEIATCKYELMFTLGHTLVYRDLLVALQMLTAIVITIRGFIRLSHALNGR